MEIVIAVCVIGILLLVSVPVISNITSTMKLKSVAEGIVSDLRLAQDKAITAGGEIKVEFRKKSIFGDRAEYSVGPFRTIKLEGRYDFRYDETIRFSKTGFPPAGGSGTVILEDLAGRSKRIIVSSAGRIRVE